MCVAIRVGVRDLVVVAGLLVVSIGDSAPASAQSFFETLFGFGSKPQRQPAPPPQQSAPPVSTAPYRLPGREPSSSANSWRSPSVSPRNERKSMRGGYRTVCVRLCDGYYFPISHGVSRRSFYRDASMCRSRCSAETQLFFMPASSSEIKTARSQSGLAYTKLENAFRYRKVYVPQCTCRPQPWSYQARARHQAYAAEAERQLAEKNQKADQEEADTSGVSAVVARQLFSEDLAEALPPAPPADWTVPRKVLVAMRTLRPAAVVPAVPVQRSRISNPEKPVPDPASPSLLRPSPVADIRQFRSKSASSPVAMRRRRERQVGRPAGWTGSLGGPKTPVVRWPGD